MSLELEYPANSRLTWANGAKKSSFYGLPSFIVCPILAWLLLPPFSTMHFLIWSSGIFYLHYKRLTFSELVGSVKIMALRGKMVVETKRDVQRRALNY